MKKSILIIDDDEDVLSVLEDILLYADFEVKGLTQTDAITEVISDFKPDLVLMDYRLRGTNGGEVCHRIKKNSQTANLPIVMISAYPYADELLKDCGCNAFISKPFDLNDLMLCVNSCITAPK